MSQITTRRVRLSKSLIRFAAALLAGSVLFGSGTQAQAQSQANDQAYTAKILEFTTEPFFLTPYVDHLPASATVPTPLDFLGHIAGAADVLTYPADIYRYMRAVAEASPRVKVFSIGTTEEGREMILVAVSSDENIAALEQIKADMARLSDPRSLNEGDAEALFHSVKPMYWATGAMHSGETGSPEMLMEMVYRLAVEETPFIQGIRDNLVFLTTPVLEVDGRAKQVDLAMAKRIDPEANPPSRLIWWGRYVAHDDNRDGIGLSLALTQNVNKTFHEYHPLVVHDLHESASYLYASTGRGPYNAWFDPIVINEWNNIAYQEVREMTAMGVPGVYTHDYYDGWAPNYMFTVANGHNAIGRFYETQGAGDGSNRIVRTNVDREWHRPNTPLPEVVWSIRNNVNLQQSAMLVALRYVADNREEFLRNYYRKGARSVAKATAEGPAAYVFPSDDSRPALQARLLQLLQDQGVEIHRANRAFEVGDTNYPSGSYVVRMDQPYSRMADMLLDKQYYNPADPAPYDDVGWTLGPLFNVKVERVEDAAVLSARMDRVQGRVMAGGSVDNGNRAQAYLINYAAEANLATFRFAHQELLMEAAESAFEAGGSAYTSGSFILPVDGNPANLGEILQEAASKYGFTARGVTEIPEVATHPLATPRVAVVHNWSSTQQEGWLRVGMEEYGIPYDYISVHEIRDISSLKGRWDVLVFGPSSGDALSILRGVEGAEPIPWKKTDVTPNIGAQDETDDTRGGIELQGVMNLNAFVEAGGLLVTVGNTSVLPVYFGLADGVQIKTTAELWAPGGVFRARVADATSPLAYGYDGDLGVYFNRAPVFAEGRGGGRGGFGGGGGGGAMSPSTDGSTTARHSGRGGVGEPDIVQGRAQGMGAANVEAFQQEGGSGAGGFGRAGAAQARVVVRFAQRPADLLISGGLVAGAEMANAPALLDASKGEGHVVMFSFNPFWRGETHGTYAMLFNALMNFDQLGVGK